MPPLKLLDTATTLRAKAATAAAGAAAAAKMAQDLLASRRAQREAAADLTAKKLTEIERTRRRLAEQLTPAELVALTETLRLLLIEARDRRHAQLEAEAALAEAEAALPAASAASVAAKNHLDGADAELAAAREGAERRAGLLLRLKTPPVSELKTTAQAVLRHRVRAPAPRGFSAGRRAWG